MTDLDTELRRLGGGGGRGTALSALRYLPPAAAGVAVPGSLTGSGAAQLVLVLGLACSGLTFYADRLLRTGRGLPSSLPGVRTRR